MDDTAVSSISYSEDDSHSDAERPIKFARAASTYHTPARENMPMQAYVEPSINDNQELPCQNMAEETNVAIPGLKISENNRFHDLISVGDLTVTDFEHFFSEDDGWLSEDSDHQAPSHYREADVFIETPKSVMTVSHFITAEVDLV